MTQDTNAEGRTQDGLTPVSTTTTVTVTDTGTTRYDTRTVLANETLSHYAQNLYERNPELRAQYPSYRALIPALVAYNNRLPASERPAGWRPIHNRTGGYCDPDRPGTITSPWLQAGQVFVYPEVANEILNPGLPCARIEEVTTEAPAPEPVPIVALAPPAAEAPLRGQFVPARLGARELEGAFNSADYFFGEPPRDAAARSSANAGRIRGSAILPDQMEGQFTKLREGDDQAGMLNGQAGGEQFFGRARNQELLRRPSATYYVDPATGRFTDPNRRYGQKLEQNMGYLVDGNRTIIEASQGGALISLPRRNNPYHAGIFTDFDTARNVIGHWSASAEAVNVITAFNGIQAMYPRVADRFLNGTEAPSAEDAQKLLDLNLRTALSPVVWSVDSAGIPVGDASVVRGAMEQVLSSPRFAALPQADQDRLRSRYQPLEAQLNRPQELYNTLGGANGVAALYNPLSEMSTERAQIGYIRNHYYEGQGRIDGPRPSRERRSELADATGQIYARRVMADGTRPPSEVELRVGTGVALDSQRQSANGVATARRAALTQMTTDPELLDLVINQAVTTPGALQYWTDPMFVASRKNPGGNREVLGFTSDGQADRFARDNAEALGGSRYRNSVDYRGPSIFDGIINNVTFGLATPGSNRNQTRGIVGLPEEVQRRWTNGTPEERDQIRGAFRNIAERALIADSNGQPIAGASLIESLDPRADEYANNNAASANYRALTARLGTNGTIGLDQLIQYNDAAYNLASRVEIGTERNVIGGNRTATVAPDAIEAAIRSGRGTVSVEGADVAAATVLDTSAINGAVSIADVRARASAAGIVLATDNNPGRLSQGSTDRSTVRMTAAASPVAFSMLTLRTLTSSELDERSQRNLRGYIESVDDGNRDYSNYADILTRGARAIRNARTTEARAAAEETTATALNGFFNSDPRRPGANVGAVTRLAGAMAEDANVSAAYTAQFTNLARVEGIRELSTTLTAEQLAQVQARVAAAASPEAAGEALRSFVTTVGAPGTAPLAATNPLTADQLSQIAALGANGRDVTDANALTTSLRSIVGNASITADNLTQLQALLSAPNAGVPDASRSALLAGLQGIQANQASTLAASPAPNAGAPLLSDDQVSRLAALAGTNQTADQLRAAITSITAGPNGQSILSGDQLNDVLTMTRTGTPDQLRANLTQVLAGIDAERGALEAHPGVSWVKIAIAVATATLPGGGGDTPLKPGEIPGCDCVVRPTIPVPVPVPVPGRPIIPGG